MNDHHELPDSMLIIVPDRTEYIVELKQEFEHLRYDTDINEIAIMSLSEDWKDEMENHINLGVDLTNYVVKNLMLSEQNKINTE